METPDWLEPLFDAAGMSGTDRWAIEERGVPSLELMETAGGALAREAEIAAGDGPIRIVIGKGNNGGDGLVAARLLRGAGHEVDVLSIWPLGELSADATANLERLGGAAIEVGEEAWASALAGSGAIVDAIFGTGFDGAPRGAARTAIDAINAVDAPVVACDVASGIDASSGEIAGAAVEAELTVTFHAAKVGHRVAPGKWHTGRLVVAPIGIPAGPPGRPIAGAIGAGRARPAAAAGGRVDEVQLRRRLRRRRLTRPHRRAVHGLAGRDPRRRRLCDGRLSRDARADPRGEADRGDDDRPRGRGRRPRRRGGGADPRAGAAIRLRGPRARARPRRAHASGWSASSPRGSRRRC